MVYYYENYIETRPVFHMLQSKYSTCCIKDSLMQQNFLGDADVLYLHCSVQ